MIHIEHKVNCCGCGACAQICRLNAISMRPDEEGFLYPEVEASRCIDCKLCERVCPILNNTSETPCQQLGYIAQNKEENILQQSTSGGVFTVLAEDVLQKGGAVFGAVMDESFRVIHVWTEEAQGLAPMRGSKYVQSEIGDSYRQAEKLLKSGRHVLYSGTPCQIEGLLSYLQCNYPNLLTVDVVCHAVASPEIWRAYTELRQSYENYKISKFLFRDKSQFGYQMTTMSAYCGDERVYAQSIAIDPYLRAFFSDICDRPSCYQCSFKKRYRKSDLTIWDCFDSDRFDAPAEFQRGKGVSSVLAHTQKAADILARLGNKLLLYPVDPDQLTASAHEMTHSIKGNAQREAFFRDAATFPPKQLFERYFPVKVKNKTEDMIRRIGLKTGLYAAIRKITKKLLPKFKRY